jgi:peroxiredoxin Q/BCP
LGTGGSTPAARESEMTAGKRKLRVGDIAPEFTLPGSDGKTHSLSDHVGKRAVVIAWFPKAFTGG